MTISTITVEATLQADGVTLHLDQKLALPPGRVLVTLQPSAPMPGPTLLEVLDRIHRDQQQRGRRPITEVEMAAEIAQMRTEDDPYEERWRQLWSQTETENARTDNP